MKTYLNKLTAHQ